MTNEIKTRRLIVTVPDVSGEEVDELCAVLEEAEIQGQIGYAFTVHHALGETLPPHVSVRTAADTIFMDCDYQPQPLTQSCARSLAGALLAAADRLADGSDS